MVAPSAGDAEALHMQLSKLHLALRQSEEARAKEQQAAHQQLAQQRHAAAATEQALRSSLEEATDEVIDLGRELRMSHARLQELEGQLNRMQAGVAFQQGLGLPVQQAAITPAHPLEDLPLSPESQQHSQLNVQRLQAQRQSQARQQGPESTGSLMTHCQPLTGMERGGSDPAAWAAQPSRPFCSRQQLAYAERARDAADLLGMTMGSGQAGMQAACASVLQQPSLPSYWQAPPWTALLRKCRGNSSQAQLDWLPSCAAEQHQSALPLEHAVDAGVPGAALQQVQEELETLHLRLQAVQQRRTLRPVECAQAAGVKVLRAIQPGCGTQGQAVKPKVLLRLPDDNSGQQ